MGDLHLWLVQDYREGDQEREDEQIFVLQDLLQRTNVLNKHRLCEREKGAALSRSLFGASGDNCHAKQSHQKKGLTGFLIQHWAPVSVHVELRASRPAVELITMGKQLLHIRGWHSIPWSR